MYERDENGTIYNPDKEVTGAQIADSFNETIQLYTGAIKDIGKKALLLGGAGLLLLSMVKGASVVREYKHDLNSARWRKYDHALELIHSGEREEGKKILKSLANHWSLESFIVADADVVGLPDLAQETLDGLEKGE